MHEEFLIEPIDHPPQQEHNDLFYDKGSFMLKQEYRRKVTSLLIKDDGMGS